MTAIKNSTVLVTGANRGLGLALVKELLTRGAAKVYATSRKPHDFNDPRVVNISLDVTDAASVARLAKLAHDANIVINNAGIFFPDTVITAKIDDIRSQFETNVIGPIQVAQTMAPVLKANNGGALMNIISVGSWLPFGSYGTTKAALWSATNSLRQELKSQNTQVTGVHVGPMDTDMVKFMEMPKEDPKEVACIALEGLEQGDCEVLVDDLSHFVKPLLSGPVEELKLPA